MSERVKDYERANRFINNVAGLNIPENICIVEHYLFDIERLSKIEVLEEVSTWLSPYLKMSIPNDHTTGKLHAYEAVNDKIEFMITELKAGN